MTDTPGVLWQQRLRALGLTQREFAEAVGLTPTNLSEGLRGNWKSGVPRYLRALIIALELLSPEAREVWCKTLHAIE